MVAEEYDANSTGILNRNPFITNLRGAVTWRQISALLSAQLKKAEIADAAPAFFKS